MSTRLKASFSRGKTRFCHYHLKNCRFLTHETKKCSQRLNEEYKKSSTETRNIPIEMQCTEKGCNQIKSASEFYGDPTSINGLKSICKSCYKAYDRQRLDCWPSLVKKAVATCNKSHGNINCENAISYEIAVKALKANSYRCSYCYKILEPNQGIQGRENPHRASLDRIDVDVIGYGNGNSQWVCNSCNKGKSVMPHDLFADKFRIKEMLIICQNLQRLTKADQDVTTNDIEAFLSKFRDRLPISTHLPPEPGKWYNLVNRSVTIAGQSHNNVDQLNKISFATAMTLLEQQNYQCNHCKIVMERGSGSRAKENYNRATLDRINVDIVGYGTGNAQWLCNACNKGKNTSPDHVFGEKFRLNEFTALFSDLEEILSLEKVSFEILESIIGKYIGCLPDNNYISNNDPFPEVIVSESDGPIVPVLHPGATLTEISQLYISKSEDTKGLGTLHPTVNRNRSIQLKYYFSKPNGEIQKIESIKKMIETKKIKKSEARAKIEKDGVIKCKGQCGLTLPLSAFNSQSDHRSGLQSYCTTCTKLNKQIWRAKKKAENKTYICPYCDKELKLKDSVTRHIKEKHQAELSATAGKSLPITPKSQLN